MLGDHEAMRIRLDSMLVTNMNLLDGATLCGSAYWSFDSPLSDCGKLLGFVTILLRLQLEHILHREMLLYIDQIAPQQRDCRNSSSPLRCHNRGKPRFRKASTHRNVHASPCHVLAINLRGSLDVAALRLFYWHFVHQENIMLPLR